MTGLVEGRGQGICLKKALTRATGSTLLTSHISLPPCLPLRLVPFRAAVASTAASLRNAALQSRFGAGLKQTLGAPSSSLSPSQAGSPNAFRVLAHLPNSRETSTRGLPLPESWLWLVVHWPPTTFKEPL